MKRLYDACRYIAGFLIMFYGFAKLNGSQFTVLQSEIDKPMSEVSGFWLTWYYFGYSAGYGGIIAVMQILAGIGLMFRRTTLLSALLLFGIMGNILLIDYFFEVPINGSGAAMLIMLLVLVILSQHIGDMREFLWTKQNSRYGNTKVGVGLWILRLLLVVIPALFTYYTANYNNRDPTPVDGKWTVQQPVTTGSRFDSLQQVYFERNRAFMVVFKYPNSWQQHHFEVDSKANTITIWDKYFTKGEELLKGNYALDGNRLIITDTKRQVKITLKK